MIIPGGKPLFDQRFVSGVMLLIFSLGTLTLIGLVVGAFIFCLYLLNLALDTAGQLAHSFAALYSQGDSFTKLIIWIVVLIIVCKVSPWIAKVVRKVLPVA
jgi:hypothetical protein